MVGETARRARWRGGKTFFFAFSFHIPGVVAAKGEEKGREEGEGKMRIYVVVIWKKGGKRDERKSEIKNSR